MSSNGVVLQYELLVVKDGRRSTVVWEGASGEDAARGYAAGHADHTVLAWRSYPQVGFFPAVNIRGVRP